MEFLHGDGGQFQGGSNAFLFVGGGYNVLSLSRARALSLFVKRIHACCSCTLSVS